MSSNLIARSKQKKPDLRVWLLFFPDKKIRLSVAESAMRVMIAQKGSGPITNDSKKQQ
ncbi:hypothetical protein [Paracoccus haematequi]|uniref:hypothetical protein n=1 Tax=Paracoccus haematequi TaxID=2491866 RepID=UPI0013DEB312|nr:hypothetical protein [Paracoccus haematequi]